MNPKQIVRISNFLGVISVLLLVYWVFTFITIQVFDLKVFRQGLTELFAISILAILAVGFGSLIINIMFNLSRIAQKHNLDVENKAIDRKYIVAFVTLFFLILAILFGSHYFSVKTKERQMIDSANSIISMYKRQNDILLNYSFTERYVKDVKDILTMYKKADNNFQNIEVIVADTLFGDDRVYLAFEGGRYNSDEKRELYKVDFIRSTSHEEREYLTKVFTENYSQTRYSVDGRRVELFFPYFSGGKKIVFYFRDYQY